MVQIKDGQIRFGNCNKKEVDCSTTRSKSLDKKWLSRNGVSVNKTDNEDSFVSVDTLVGKWQSPCIKTAFSSEKEHFEVIVLEFYEEGIAHKNVKQYYDRDCHNLKMNVGTFVPKYKLKEPVNIENEQDTIGINFEYKGARTPELDVVQKKGDKIRFGKCDDKINLWCMVSRANKMNDWWYTRTMN